MAKKRLYVICCRYQNYVETKAGIQKAWEKFRTNGHLVFLNELSVEDRKELERPMVSYWIPWNVAFKDSISTPVRTVFDASASTSSGFSLNDCLAQGSPNLVKLLSMLLEWQMGRNALVRDISQLYPTVLLVPKHWRYQHILLRENLDPSRQLLDAVIVKLAFSVSRVSAHVRKWSED